MLTNVIVFIGLLVIFNSLAGWIFEHTIKAFPEPVSAGFGAGHAYFSAHDLGSVAVMLCVLSALYAFFRFTPVGLAMRAAAQNPESARLVGIRVSWMLAMGWGLAAAIGAVAGMMVAPVVYLDPNMMSGILLYGFAAALLGGIDNPCGAVIGGFIVGVLENLLGAYVIGTELKLTVALVLIVGTLTLKPNGLFGKTRGDTGMRPARSRTAPCAGSGAGVAAAGRRAVVLPFLVKNYRVFQFNLVLDLRDRGAGAEHPDRLQRPDLARPRRLLRHRRLYRCDADGPGRLALLGHAAGRRRWCASRSAS